MHEWALAEAVVARATELARENGMATIDEVVVRLGELQNVSREALEFGLSVAQTQEPLMEGTVFRFEIEPAELACRPCGRSWLLRESRGGVSEEDLEAIHLLPETVHIYVSCPDCGSPDFAVTRGRGLSLGAVTG
jgi:hydrogenase nickel incorporation protein HypA/HybF